MVLSVLSINYVYGSKCLNIRLSNNTAYNNMIDYLISYYPESTICICMLSSYVAPSLAVNVLWFLLCYSVAFSNEGMLVVNNLLKDSEVQSGPSGETISRTDGGKVVGSLEVLRLVSKKSVILFLEVVCQSVGCSRNMRCSQSYVEISTEKP